MEVGVFAAVFVMLLVRVPPMAHFLVNADHGYGLAAGNDLLHGKLPGVHSLSNYGPLVAVLAAATLNTTGNVVGEAVFCAAAWAVAVWLLSYLARRNFGSLAGGCTSIVAIFFLARFHKWYMWLLPLAALAAADLSSAESSRRRWGLAGLVCGVGALLRPELGTAALVVLVLIGVAHSLSHRGRSRVIPWGPLALSFAAPAVMWAAVVLAVAGVDGVVTAASAIPESVVGSVEHWSKPPPPFNVDAPFSVESGHALALKLLPAVEIVAIVFGGWLGYVYRRGVLAREGRFLAAMGAMGFAFYPHTIYRADINHLLQGIWPLLIGVPALCALSVRFARSTTNRLGWLPMVPAAVLGVLAAVALLPIATRPHFDLASIHRAPLAGLMELSRGPSAIPEHPYVEVVQAIQRMTAPTDEVMVIPWAPQLLVFAQRPSSGLSFAYQRGIFDSRSWRRERLALVERRPPALVIAPYEFYHLAPDESFRATQPELYDFVRAHYTVVAVFEAANMIALAANR